jgi:DNA-binding NarL/FixJ family response regulator
MDSPLAGDLRVKSGGGGRVSLGEEPHPPLLPPTSRIAGPVPDPITVAATQFEDLVGAGLRQLIEDDPDLELVADGVTFDSLDAVLGDRAPAVALVNFASLPRPAAVYQLHQAHPDTRIVVLADNPGAAECNQMLSFGATACLAKDTQARDIVSALHLASRGMHVLPRTARKMELAGSLSGPGPDLLTAREADVLELLQQGLTNAQIAHSLSIGVETVRTHARHIYRKLGVSNRRELVKLARPGAAGAVPAVVPSGGLGAH